MDALAETWLGGDAPTPAALDRAVEVRRVALAQLDADLPADVRRDLLNNLAVDLSSRYRQRGLVADLREACDLGCTVLDGAVPGERFPAAANLAGRLSMLARHAGHEGELDTALHVMSGELAEAEADDPGRAVAVTTLAGLWLHRWQRDGDVADLAEAATWLLGEPQPAGTPGLVNVAGLFLEYAQETQDGRFLDRAETLLGQALDAATGRSRVGVLRSLADLHLHRFDIDGDAARLTAAVEFCDAALAVVGEGPERAGLLASRSMARATAARRGTDRMLMDAAIGDARDAAELAGHQDVDPSESANALSMLLAERYDLIGDSRDLDESIARYEAVLASPKVGKDARAALLTNFATGLLSRFERDDDPADVRRAAVLADEAVAGTDPRSVHLAARYDTAGRIRAALAHRTGSAQDAQTAERHARAAVEATPATSGDRALYLNNWAMWVTDRWDRTGELAALGEAITLLDTALECAQGDGMLRATIMFNLGARLQEQFEHTLTTDTADWDDLQRACDLLDDVLAAGLPHLNLHAGKRLGDIAWRLGMWPEAEHALRLSLAAAGELTGARPIRPDQERARSGVQGIGALAALCAARAGDLRSAAVHLEQASATLMAEALGVPARTVTFDDLAGAAGRMHRSVLLLAATPAGGVAVLVGDDGAVEGVELPDLTEDAVADRASAFRQVLADATDPAAAESGRATDHAGDPLAECYAAADALVAWTHTGVLEPLTTLLADVGRLAVLALGRLNWLPLTAAGASGQPPTLARHEPVMMIRVTGEEPGDNRVEEPGDNRVEEHGGERVEEHGGERVEDPGGERVEDPGSRELRAAVWADTGPADRAIPGVVDEARRVAAAYRHSTLMVNDRTAGTPATQTLPLRSSGNAGIAGRDSVRAPVSDPTHREGQATRLVRDLLSVDVAHLACHCDLDLDRPGDSVIQVDPPVRVGDLGPGTATRTHVVLSACDAALTAASLPDEALSPATAFLLAGAAMVTAPVWPVDDESSGEFLAAYHQMLAAGVEPGAALNHLQTEWARNRPAFLYAPWVVVARRPS